MIPIKKIGSSLIGKLVRQQKSSTVVPSDCIGKIVSIDSNALRYGIEVRWFRSGQRYCCIHMFLSEIELLDETEVVLFSLAQIGHKELL